MATWNDFVTTAKDRKLIRKSLDAVVMIDDIEADLLTTIMSATTTDLEIPSTFKSLGWHSDEGLSWAREVENSELSAHGSVEAVRTDVRRVTHTLSMTCLETNLQTLGLQVGVELSGADGSAKEVVITEPSLPDAREFRLLALSVDDTDFGEIYFGKYFASAKVTGTTPGAWSDGDNAQSYGLTITAFKDETAGFSVCHFMGGPGFSGLREAMGWEPAAG
ncbi:hypothetical protein [Nocardioides bruguierae]|uniref:Uncharacterized protein n=1 Tax=Nocardioides bruguierae TaxID=2945102 RepID=A0A9X2DAU0_9ACTN|nr:hypothetical protein [Nocardioides bruguierae]MCM0622511.1 hypothetical protein [Nocardioides bruguierae]